MAQYQPLVNPTSLANLNQVPLDMTLEGMDWFNQARNADTQNFQDLPGLLAHEQALRPLKQQQMQIANDTGLAQLPGVKAQSSMLQRKNKMEDITFDDDVKVKLSDLATKLKENDIKQIEAEGQKLLTSPNPDDRWRGAQLLAASKEMFAANHRQYQAIELEGIKHRNAKELQNLRNEGMASRGGSKPRDFISALDKMKKASERAQALTTEIASLQGDDPRREVYGAMLEALGPQIQAEREDAAARGAGGWVKDHATGKWTPYKPPELQPGVPLPGRAVTTERPARQAANEKKQESYEKGQVYPGSTGKYKYLGGDPSDINSWEKAK